jgi:predicted small lipoprotein YifL
MRGPAILRSLAVLLIGGAVVAACGPRHPLGIADADWQAMAPQQRVEAYNQQADLDRARAERRAAEAAIQEAADKARAAALESRRRQALYGERVQCVLRDAEVRTGNRWRPVLPMALDLVTGMETELLLEEPSDRTFGFSTRAYAAFDGQTVSVCRDPEGSRRGSAACARLLGTFQDYRQGLDERVDAPSFLRGSLRCSLVPAQGMPNTIILERSRARP